MKTNNYISAVVLAVFVIINFAGLTALAATENKQLNPESYIQMKALSNGSIQVIILEDKASELLNEVIKTQAKDFVSSGNIHFSDNFLEASVALLKSLPGSIYLKANFTTKDNKLYPQIISVRYGFFPIPAFLVKMLINRATNNGFAKDWVETPGIEWHKLEIKEGKVVIEFKEAK